MTRGGLVLSGLTYRRSDAILTLACIVLSFLLFGMMMSLRESFSAGLDAASAHRLRSQGASSLAALLPLQYARRIAAVDGVDYVSFAYGAPAAFEDNPSHMLLQAVPPDRFFDLFPELHIDPAQRSAFESEKRALVAGPAALARYGWKLGQEVVLRTNIVRDDGSASWRFEIVGTYDASRDGLPADLTFVRYDYINDSRVDTKDQVMGFIEHIGSARRADSIAAAVDALFSTSSPRLRTLPENQVLRRQLSQFGDFTKILICVTGVVFLSLLLLMGSVFSERADARLRDFATLRALGFAPLQVFGVVVGEALAFASAGCTAGLGLAWVGSRWARPHVTSILPGFHFPAAALVTGFVLALLFAVCASALPARRAASADVVKLLRMA